MSIKWDKLNKEFYSVIENLSPEDWNNWDRQRVEKREMKRKILQMDASMQELKLIIAKLKESVIYSSKLETEKSLFAIPKMDLETRVITFDTEQVAYPMAA